MAGYPTRLGVTKSVFASVLLWILIITSLRDGSTMMVLFGAVGGDTLVSSFMEQGLVMDIVVPWVPW